MFEQTIVLEPGGWEAKLGYISGIYLCGGQSFQCMM